MSKFFVTLAIISLILTPVSVYALNLFPDIFDFGSESLIGKNINFNTFLDNDKYSTRALFDNKDDDKSIFKSERVIISFDEQPTRWMIDIVEFLGFETKYEYDIIPAIAGEAPIPVLQAISKLDFIDIINPDLEVKTLLSDSITLINANPVWSLGYNGSGVTIAVIDTGVDYNHPALKGRVINGTDYVNDDNDPMDDNGHGTHCAGTVASNDTTYTGVAPNATILAIKVLRSDGRGYESDVISGISEAVNSDVDIISLSLGGKLYKCPCDGNDLAKAANNAFDSGVVVVAASGNDGRGKISAPACGSNVIAVGAVTKENVLWPDTNTGHNLDILAPGVSITSTCMGGGFCVKSGTSMATPHVAGVSALLLDFNSSLSQAEVKEALLRSATNNGNWSITSGYGRLNASNAYEFAAAENKSTFPELQSKGACSNGGSGSSDVLLWLFPPLWPFLILGGSEERQGLDDAYESDFGDTNLNKEREHSQFRVSQTRDVSAPNTKRDAENENNCLYSSPGCLEDYIYELSLFTPF